MHLPSLFPGASGILAARASTLKCLPLLSLMGTVTGEFDGAMSGFLTNLNEEDAANQKTSYFLLRINLPLIFSQTSLAQKSPGELDENHVREGVETIGVVLHK